MHAQCTYCASVVFTRQNVLAVRGEGGLERRGPLRAACVKGGQGGALKAVNHMQLAACHRTKQLAIVAEADACQRRGAVLLSVHLYYCSHHCKYCTAQGTYQSSAQQASFHACTSAPARATLHRAPNAQLVCVRSQHCISMPSCDTDSC